MKTKHLLLSMIILAVLALFSCEGLDEPNDPLNPNGSDTTSIVDTTVIVVIDSTIIVTQNITESVTWKSGMAYIIDGAIRVGSSENVVLTIEPGVVVRFNKDASLAFAYSSGTFASVKALGTAINPIIFEPNTSDAWKCVAFFEGALDCEFENCSFAGGGSNDYYGNLYISETQVAFTKCVFNQSASSGIKLDGTGGFSAFAYNTLSNIADYPIEIGTSQIHTIGESNTFETGERIYINDNNFSDAGDYLWRNHSIPYLIDGGMRIGSENTQGVNISVEEATEFNFTTGSYIDFAYSDDTYATFIAKGSVDDPIVFTSASPSKNAGDWSSLRFYKGAINCELDYCNFSYGGEDSYYGMVYLDESQVSITNSTIRNSATYGIKAVDNGNFFNFHRNTFSDNALFPIMLDANAVYSMGPENTFESGTSILVSAYYDLNMTGEFTWLNQNVPYYIDGRLDIGSVKGTTININKGTIIEFADNEYLSVAHSSDEFGQIISKGTADSPVIFTSHSPSPDKGDWRGITLHDGAEGTKLDYCRIEYAGGYYGCLSLSDLGTNTVTVDNSVIAYSSTYGIKTYKSSVDYSTVTFIDNDDVDYKVQ